MSRPLRLSKNQRALLLRLHTSGPALACALPKDESKVARSLLGRGLVHRWHPEQGTVYAASARGLDALIACGAVVARLETPTFTASVLGADEQE
jgi:hypothetical protein